MMETKCPYCGEMYTDSHFCSTNIVHNPKYCEYCGQSLETNHLCYEKNPNALRWKQKERNARIVERADNMYRRLYPALSSREFQVANRSLLLEVFHVAKAFEEMIEAIEEMETSMMDFLNAFIEEDINPLPETDAE